MKNLDNIKCNSKLSIGEKIKYTKSYMFGKTGIETAKIVMITNWSVLLDNGDSLSIFRYNNLIK
tara:strand:+ start:1135 stop:1326 length:192 start_codon:yes stop_codon:yes gene_type:complete